MSIFGCNKISDCFQDNPKDLKIFSQIFLIKVFIAFLNVLFISSIIIFYDEMSKMSIKGKFSSLKIIINKIKGLQALNKN